VAKTKPARLTPLSIAAWIAGAALGAYSTINLVFPAVFAGLTWYGLRRLAPAAKQPAAAAIGWQAGQLGWFILGVAFAPAGLGRVGLDILILGGLLVWLYLSLGRIAAWTLVVYQALSLLVNIWMFLHAPIQSATAKALAVHIVWRVCAIALLVLFIRRKDDAPDPARTARTFE
jgi:hypothetical protein